MIPVEKRWPGATFVLLGGGPSLTLEDVEYCRQKARVIAINEAYRLAPWAEVLYACDHTWWRRRHPEFKGLKYALMEPPLPDREDEPQRPCRYGKVGRWPRIDVPSLRATGEFGLELDPSGLRHGRNSGYQAVNLAVHLGATRIILLGFDMQITHGRQRWHSMSQIHSPYPQFRNAFATIDRPLKKIGVEVINCSRETALEVFPRRGLAVTLAEAVAA